MDEPKNDAELRQLIDTLLELVEPLEERIGIPRKTLKPLLLNERNDWAFIIQLAVILEASLAEVLVSHLHNEGIRQHLRGLNMQGRTGRIPLAVQTGLLEPPHGEILSAIADVRNAFAHRTKFIGTSLTEYGQALSGQEKQQLAKRLFTLSDEAAKAAEWVANDLRFALWWAACKVLLLLSKQDIHAQYVRSTRELQTSQAEFFEAAEDNPALLNYWRSRADRDKGSPGGGATD